MPPIADETLPSDWDVIVVGAGPAGAATAATLARLGRRVLLVEEREAPRQKLGESLPPSAVGLVRHFLGDPSHDGALRDVFFKTAGNVAVWADDAPQTNDFFFTAGGHGWCVERMAFDEALRQAAVQAGAVLRQGARFLGCHRKPASAHWEIHLSSPAPTNRPQRCRYLVDATGRRAAVAKAAGVEELQSEDRLFAYAQWYSLDDIDDDRYTRIEAVPHGWWYSNRLPPGRAAGTRRLVIMLSDADLPQARQAARADGHQWLLQQTRHIGPLLASKGYRPEGSVRGAPAGSRRLQAFCADAVMAIGDAAQTYDPLSSQGIDKALRSGSHAGHLIHYALTDSPADAGATALGPDNTYIRQYAAEQEQLWQTYMSRWTHYYRLQPRWREEPFWRRRER